VSPAMAKSSWTPPFWAERDVRSRTRAAASVLPGVRLGVAGVGPIRPANGRSRRRRWSRAGPRFVSRLGYQGSAHRAGCPRRWRRGPAWPGRRGPRRAASTDALPGSAAPRGLSPWTSSYASWRGRCGRTRGGAVLERVNAQRAVPALMAAGSPPTERLHVSFISLAQGPARGSWLAPPGASTRCAWVTAVSRSARRSWASEGVVREPAHCAARALVDVASSAVELGASGARLRRRAGLPAPGNIETGVWLAEGGPRRRARCARGGRPRSSRDAAHESVFTLAGRMRLGGARCSSGGGARSRLRGCAATPRRPHTARAGGGRGQRAPPRSRASPRGRPRRRMHHPSSRSLARYSGTGVPSSPSNFGQVGFLATVDPRRARRCLPEGVSPLDFDLLLVRLSRAGAGRRPAASTNSRSPQVGRRRCVLLAYSSRAKRFNGALRRVVVPPGRLTGYNLYQRRTVLPWDCASTSCPSSRRTR